MTFLIRKNKDEATIKFGAIDLMFNNCYTNNAKMKLTLDSELTEFSKEFEDLKNEFKKIKEQINDRDILSDVENSLKLHGVE